MAICAANRNGGGKEIKMPQEGALEQKRDDCRNRTGIPAEAWISSQNLGEITVSSQTLVLSYDFAGMITHVANGCGRPEMTFKICAGL